ncbi:AzlC family ABC transporter permease [Vibrio sp. WXL103]|uniref:AzlC family ABC transporter permease n=1 Tax=Vibrio sp. WXL103 TaxID=3450710 RepID=UPI003EC86277
MDKDNHSNRARALRDGTVAMMPLSLAVVPWGFLAGSFAIDSGLMPLEGQAMSAILFAGSAQLVAMGMIKAGASLATMMVTIFFITSRHLLYSLTMRRHIAPLSLRWRITLGFLLTDELFALCGHQKPERFDPWYALGAGVSFYLIWNLATLVGIVVGGQIPDLQQYGLEFAVAATFISIVVPNIQTLSTLLAALSALISAVLFAYWQVESGLVLASLIGMTVGYVSGGR